MSISNLLIPNTYSLFAGSFTVDDISMSDLTVSGNIGVGTTTPAERLHINNSAATFTGARFSNGAATSGLNVGVSSAGVAQMNMINNQPITFSTNNTERMRILNTGSVLLNRTFASTMGGTLDVNGPITCTNTFTLSNTESTFNVGESTSTTTKNLMTIQGTSHNGNPLHRFFRFRSGGSPAGMSGIAISDYGDANYLIYGATGRIAFSWVGTNANLLDPANFGTEIMSIRSNSRVGILNTNPTSTLDVGGNVTCRGSLIGGPYSQEFTLTSTPYYFDILSTSDVYNDYTLIFNNTTATDKVCKVRLNSQQTNNGFRMVVVIRGHTAHTLTFYFETYSNDALSASSNDIITLAGSLSSVTPAVTSANSSEYKVMVFTFSGTYGKKVIRQS